MYPRAHMCCVPWEQEWRSGESARLPPMWPGLTPSPGLICRLTLLSSKTNTSKFQLDLERTNPSKQASEFLSVLWAKKLHFLSDNGIEPKLSKQILYTIVTPNDSDGFMVNRDINKENPLGRAIYTSLNGIDAPELYAVHFMKQVICSMCFVRKLDTLACAQFTCSYAYLCTLEMGALGRTTKKGDLWEELPKKGFSVPFHVYGRPFKEYWFRFLGRPGLQEQNFISSLEKMISPKTELHKRLMSTFSISEAKEHPTIPPVIKCPPCHRLQPCLQEVLSR